MAFRRISRVVSIAVEQVVIGLITRKAKQPSGLVEALENRTLFGFYSANPNDETPAPITSTADCPLPPPVPQQDGKSGASSASKTEKPIRNFDGTPVISATDLSSDGFGMPWGHTRSWTGLNNSSLNGNGWSVEDLPYVSVGGGAFGNSSGDGSNDPNNTYNGVLGGTAYDNRLTVESGGTATTTFSVDVPDHSYGSYALWGAGNQTLQWDKTNRLLKLTDAQGNITEFFDVRRASDATSTSDPYYSINSSDPDRPIAHSGAADMSQLYGEFKRFIAANGTVETEANYDSNGYLTSVTRTDPSVSVSVRPVERYTYSYTGDTGFAALTNDLVIAAGGQTPKLIARVSMDRSSDGGTTWATVRYVDYSYYTGRLSDGSGGYVNDQNGRLGDLKLAQIKNGSGAVIDSAYYRYYKFTGEGDKTVSSVGPTNQHLTTGGPNVTAFTPGVAAYGDLEDYNPSNPGIHHRFLMSGLKTVVDGASLDRLVANVADLSTATDGQIMPYVNQFFRYERWADHTGTVAEADGGYANIDWRVGYRMGSRFRVVEEIAQGEGCSTCTGGEGTYRLDYFGNNNNADKIGFNQIDYNTWRMRTTEYLPDSTNTKVSTVLGAAALTSSGTTATVYWPSNGFAVGEEITVTGSTIAAYNGKFVISKMIDRDNFQFVLSTSATSPATGTITMTNDSVVAASQWADNDKKIVYTNEVGLPILEVMVDANGTATTSDDRIYSTYYRYDNQGRLILEAEPSAVAAYDPANPSSFENNEDLAGFNGTSYANLLDHQGLIHTYTFGTSTTTGLGDGSSPSSISGDVAGYLKQDGLQNGDLGTSIPQAGYTYFARILSGISIYPLASESHYRNTDGTGAQTVSYAYTWFGSTQQIQSLTVTHPVIGNGSGSTPQQNGSGAANSATDVYDVYGRVIWHKDESGFLTYFQYDTGTGAVTKMIQDVNTSLTSDFSNLPAGWSTVSGGGLHLITTMQVDGLGRTTKKTDANSNVTYTVYNDANHEIRVYQSAAGTFSQIGPIHIYRTYRPAAGAGTGQRQVYTEEILSSAIPSLVGGVPDGSETIDSSNIQSLARALTNDAGQVIEKDIYTSLSGVTYSQSFSHLGVSGANYLATFIDYDDRGRIKRVQDPTGTITRYLYDARGLQTAIWKGIDDVPTSGYWSPENESGAALVKIWSADYNVDGDMTFSRQVLSHDTSTGNDITYYQTTYAYDFRDRLTDARGTDGIAKKFTLDNLGEQTQTDTYADLNSNFVEDGGEAIGRTILGYDDQGQVYQSTLYQNSRALNSAVMTSSGTIATVKLTNHGFSNGQSVTIAGATPSTYDGTFTLTVVDANTFTFTIPGSTTSPAAGSRITVTANKSLTTNYWYDARGNQVKTQDPNGLITKTFYDGAGRLYQTDTSADATETASGSYADALTLTGDQVIEEFDYYLDHGGRTRIVTDWKRDGSQYFTGTGQPYDTSNYDHNSTAYYYDAANRLIATANFGRDGTESGSSAADHLVIKQYTHSYVDVNANGIPDVIDHADGYDPGLSNSASQTSYEWIYTGYSYDAAGRQQFVTDNAGRKTETLYDLAGRTTATIANYTGDGSVTETTPGDQNQTTQYVYDSQGRLSQQIALKTNGSGNSVESQKTVYTYGDPTDSSLVTETDYPGCGILVIIDPLPGQQPGDSFSFHPDATLNSYDRLGRVTTMTSHRELESDNTLLGIVHTYTYDSAGRLSKDSIGTGTLPKGVDGTVRTIQYTYDDQSRVSTVSSLNASGAVVNQVAYTYDAWGNVTKDAEEHRGAVTASTPAVNYYYDDGSGTGTAAHYVRINKVLYPKNNGTSVGTFTYSYESWATGAALNRLQYLRDGNGLQLVQYQWLGANTLTNTILHPQVSGGLTMNDGSSGSHYLNLDRYYRNSTLQWQNTSGTTQFQQLLYTYDRMGNVLTKDNNSAGTGAGNWDETYAYDGLNRLVDYKRGSLSGGTISGSNLKFEQTWSLDALGNWIGYTQTNNDSTLPSNFTTFSQTRTADAANEITSMSGGGFASTAYDASGNQTAGPKTGAESTQLGYLYDGWNRLVGVDANHDGDLYDAGDVRYSYDGTGRRITKFTDSTNDSTNNAGLTEEYYQNEQNEVLEVRIGTVIAGVKTVNANPKERYLWDLNYVDAPAMVELDTNTDGTRDYRLWPTWDANHNITSLVSDHGQTIERYEYTPYGQQIVLNGSNNYAGTGADPDGADWSVDTNGSDFGFMLGFQGLRFNPESGDWETDNRMESPDFGFTQRDPLGTAAYASQGMGLYQFAQGNPATWTDPTGLDTVVIPASAGRSAGSGFAPVPRSPAGSTQPMNTPSAGNGLVADRAPTTQPTTQPSNPVNPNASGGNAGQCPRTPYNPRPDTYDPHVWGGWFGRGANYTPRTSENIARDAAFAATGVAVAPEVAAAIAAALAKHAITNPGDAAAVVGNNLDKINAEIENLESEISEAADIMSTQEIIERLERIKALRQAANDITRNAGNN